MERAAWSGVAAALAVLVVVGPGCKKREDAGSGGGGTSSRAEVDLTADRAALDKSWILDVARDPAPLGALATANGGWRALFGGDATAALVEFEEGIKRGGDASARIGAARAALELAEANRLVGELVRALTPQLMRAQATRPGAESSAATRAFFLARHAAGTGERLDTLLKDVAEDGPMGPWAALLRPEAADPAAALLRGAPEGLDAELPAGATQTFSDRLHLAALVGAGRLAEARARGRRIDPKAHDFVIDQEQGRTGFYDPGIAGVESRLYAAVALDALSGVEGWGDLLRARALLLLGRPQEAAETLEKLLAAPPDTADLAVLVLEPILNAADLRDEAVALRVRALVESGQPDAARALAEQLPTSSVAQRVRRAWAESLLGAKPDATAFPEDRAVLARAMNEAIVALGDAGKGAADVTELALVERYVDGLQRRFAESLARSGEPTLSVKAREGAEDKSAAAGPSGRNTISSLAATALDNAAIGRPRVALKYLQRMNERLPTVAAPAEMLADLLSARALEQGGGPNVGQ